MVLGLLLRLFISQNKKELITLSKFYKNHNNYKKSTRLPKQVLDYKKLDGSIHKAIMMLL